MTKSFLDSIGRSNVTKLFLCCYCCCFLFLLFFFCLPGRGRGRISRAGRPVGWSTSQTEPCLPRQALLVGAVDKEGSSGLGASDDHTRGRSGPRPTLPDPAVPCPDQEAAEKAGAAQPWLACAAETQVAPRGPSWGAGKSLLKPVKASWMDGFGKAGGVGWESRRRKPKKV